MEAFTVDFYFFHFNFNICRKLDVCFANLVEKIHGGKIQITVRRLIKVKKKNKENCRVSVKE